MWEPDPLSAHLLAQLLAVVVFSLITSCQYANKLPRLFSILGPHCKIYDRNDDFFFSPFANASLYDACTCGGCRSAVCFPRLMSLVMCCLPALWVPQFQAHFGVGALGPGKSFCEGFCLLFVCLLQVLPTI